MKFTDDLAAVHAYLCGDGYVIKNPETQKSKYYMIGFRNTNFILLKDFQRRFEKVFGKKPYITNEGRCRIGSKEIYEILTCNFGSFYSYHWTAPSLSNEISKIWLRAFFDCEGWITCRSHKSRSIGLECVNKNGIFQIKNLLENLGIMCKVKKRNTKNIFLLSIFGKDNLIKFRDKINFLHPSKKDKLECAIKDFMNYYWEFPHEKASLECFIRDMFKIKAKVKKGNYIVRLISSKEENLVKLKEGLSSLFGIESRVGVRKNGHGNIYFEMSINKKMEIRKLIKHDLMDDKEKEKWLNSKKSMM